MSNLNVSLTVLGLALGVSTTLFMLLPILKTKGVQVDKVLEKADTILNGVDGALNATKVIIPGNEAVNILDTIEKEAHKAVNLAQQLFISSQLSPDKRKEKAKEYISAALKVLKVEVTPELETVINGAIEDVIYASKTEDEVAIQKNQAVQKLTTQLQAEKEQLQVQNSQLQVQNQQLNQALSQVQNTVNNVQ